MAAATAAALQAMAATADGGQVTTPTGAIFGSPCMGLLTVRFGVPWIISVPAA